MRDRCVFLASRAGSFATGATIPIDGGSTALPAAARNASLEATYEKDHKFN